MRIRRVIIIIPAILALGVAGSSVAATASVTASAHLSSVHAQAQGAASPYVFLHSTTH
jgi:hypothetical protein